MSISGHKTVSTLMRYNITSGADKIEALDKMAAHLATQPTKRQEGAWSKCSLKTQPPNEKADKKRTVPPKPLSLRCRMADFLRKVGSSAWIRSRSRRV